MRDKAKPFLYVATPCFGGQLNVYFAQALLTLQKACAAKDIGLHVDLMGGDALITRARSVLAQRFLEHGRATHLLFIDADIGFGPENVFRLLEAAKPVIGAVYPLKQIDWEKVRTAAKAGAPAGDLQARGVGYVVRFLPTPDKSVDVNDGFAQVSYVGTGFLMIERSALQRLCDAHPELQANMGDLAGGLASRATMIFDTLIEPETGQYLSEDYAFCRRWRDLGGVIWADFEARLSHVGNTVYQGSLLQALKPV
jgi:hypothetical protein